MIEIDGSHGEGGGQIVRTAVALSAVTGNSVRIRNIRRGRPKPGLAAQHVRAIESLARICTARTGGVALLSPEVKFCPGAVRGGRYEIDIGTAGSVTLLVQCLLPALTVADGPVELLVLGGTDVRWSPTIDYLKNVALPAISRFGVVAEVTVNQRGYYPRGGGSISLKVSPSSLRPARIEPCHTSISGTSHSSGLPAHVARRQAEAAADVLLGAGYRSLITQEVLSLPSTGSGISIWSAYKGGSALGERGLRAEEVGRSAAMELIAELESPSAVDIHLADQLVPYIALSGGSFTTRAVTAHTATNIWTAGQILGSEIRLEELQEDGVVRIEAARGRTDRCA